MKRILIITAMLLCGLVASAASRIEKCSMSSDILGVTKEYVVYVPSGYDENPDKAYPVLYLLHGLSGDCGTWTEKYDMKVIADWRIDSGFSLPMLIVMPDARGVLENRKGKNVGYVNREGWMYEDYFFDELIPEIEKKYRVLPGRRNRAISGLSMGGGGTVIYAMHRPQHFSSACPMAARVEGTPGIEPGTGGDSEEFYAYSRKHNMVEYFKSQTPERIAEIGTVRWYIDCADGGSLLEGNTHLYFLMRKAGFTSVNLRVREGAHKADYWRTSLPEVMTYCSIGFAE